MVQHGGSAGQGAGDGACGGQVQRDRQQVLDNAEVYVVERLGQ